MHPLKHQRFILPVKQLIGFLIDRYRELFFEYRQVPVKRSIGASSSTTAAENVVEQKPTRRLSLLFPQLNTTK
ncbi:MAG: hypothetical protein IJT66_00340 [Clostridia bacterium]|nr:hypothetical protein [Clostridia bacterium]